MEPDDVTIFDGVSCYHIRDNARRGVKTFSSQRLLPIHSHLIEAGVLPPCGRYPQTRCRCDFPRTIPDNESQSFGDKLHYNWSKAVGLQLAGNPRKLCFHSLRHYVIACLKHLPEISDKQLRDLLGHSGQDVRDESYDEATPLPVLQGVVERFPRVL